MTIIRGKDDTRAASTERRGTLLAIQYLRGLAALMVVVHHARNPNAAFFNPIDDYPAFAWGVDTFFVISGFIMGVTGSRSLPRVFITKRIIRIVPLYWIATAAAVLVLERGGALSMTRELWGSIVKSLLFIPHENVREPGTFTPFLVPGWTLNFEMFFYVVFFVGLLLARPLAVTATVLPALVLVGLVFDPQGPIGATYTDPLLLEFLFGHLLAVAYMKGRTTSALWPLLPLGFIGLMTCPILGDGGATMTTRIVCATAIVAGAVALDDRTPLVPLGKLLGDASYSIYLTHVIIGLEITTHLVARLPVTGPAQFATLIVVAVVVSAATGVATYLWVERPILHALRKRLLPKRPNTLGR